MAFPSLATIGTALTATAIGAVVGAASYQAYKAIDVTQVTILYNEQSSTEETKKKGRQKLGDTYALDRSLPQDIHGVPIPDADVPHTQLGTKNGGK